MMPLRSLVLLLAIAPLASAHAQAVGTSAAGKQWYLLDESGMSMTVMATDDATRGSPHPRALVGVHFPSTFRLGASSLVYGPGGNERSVDYGLLVYEYDCNTRGLSRILAGYEFVLDSNRFVTKSEEPRAWKTPFMDNVAVRQWEIACNTGEPGTRMPAVAQHRQMTIAYRERRAEADRQAQAEDAARKRAEQDRIAARTAENIVPQTALSAAANSGHWHASHLSRSALIAVDIHGVETGSSPDFNRMTTVIIFPDDITGSDFTLQYQEFDCATPGRNRILAYADYALDGASAKPRDAAHGIGDWSNAKDGEIVYWGWDWACNGEKPQSALPRDKSFVELLAYYREELLGGTPR